MKNLLFRARKVISIALATTMVVSLFPATSVFAEELPDEPTTEAIETEEESSTEDTTEVTTEVTEVDSEGTTEETTEVTTETTVPEVSIETPAESNPEDVGIETEETTEEEKEDSEDVQPSDTVPTFDRIYNGVDVNFDASSCELLIATSDPSVFTADTEVVSEYNGIYLTRYPDAPQTKSAYSYYYDKVDLVEVNASIKANEKEGEENTSSEADSNEDKDAGEESDDADPEPESETVLDTDIPNNGHGEADMSNINNGDDAFSNVNGVAVANYSGYIALIDSGATAEGIVKKSVSVIGDETGDDNGHGTKMVGFIEDVNKDAKVISIKALDSNARGNVSDVYAAIQYAIAAKVSVINLSMSSVATSESELLEEAITTATNSGIIVVCSAGNNGKNVKYYMPANIAKAYTIGACDKDGVRINVSNFGELIDYYVVANSTSEAAAKFSGLAAKGLKNIEDNDIVFKKEDVEKDIEDDVEEEEEEDDDSKWVKVEFLEGDDYSPVPATGDWPTVYIERNTDDNRSTWNVSFDGVNAHSRAYCIDPHRTAPKIGASTTFGQVIVPESISRIFTWMSTQLPSSVANPNRGYSTENTLWSLRYAWHSWGSTYGVESDWSSVKAASFHPVPYTDSTLSSWTNELWDLGGPTQSNGVLVDYSTNNVVTNWRAGNSNYYSVKLKQKSAGRLFFLTPAGQEVTNYSDSQSNWTWNKNTQKYTSAPITFNGDDKDNFCYLTVPADSTYYVRTANNVNYTYTSGQTCVLYPSDVLWIETTASNSGSHATTGREYTYWAYGITAGTSQRLVYLYGWAPEAVSFAWKAPAAPHYYVDLVKESNNKSCTDGNVNYSLAGATYGLYTDSSCTNKIGTFTVKADGTSNTIEVTDNMSYTAGSGFSNTTFYAKELTPGKNYTVNNRVLSATVSSTNGSTGHFQAKGKDSAGNWLGETPKMDPLSIVIRKTDGSGNTVPLGDTTLAGAQFTVKFYPQDISGNLNPSVAPARTWVLETKKVGDEYLIDFDNLNYHKVSGDDFYRDNTGRIMFPLGFITIQETKAPDGYKTTGDFWADLNDGSTRSADSNGVLILKAHEQGSAYVDNTLINPNDDFLKEDQPIRADIELYKVDENDEPMAGVEFEVTAKSTGQKVTLVTDDNGYVSTSKDYVSHLVNTNAGTSMCGTWFGDLAKVSDSYGALFWDDYEIREVRSDANEGKQLELIRTVTKAEIEANDGGVINVLDKGASDPEGKNWNMPKPVVHTTAIAKETSAIDGTDNQLFTQEDISDETDPSIILAAAKDQTIVDEVTYLNLRAGTDYTLLTELMIVDKDGNVSPYLADQSFTDAEGNNIVEGEAYRKLHTFTTNADYTKSIYEKVGIETVELEHINPLGYEGCHFVVYETCYLGTYTDITTLPSDDNADQYPEYNDDDDMKVFPVIHRDPTDDFQTVTMPDIHTTLKDKVSEDKVSMPKDDKVLVDSVYYTGLKIGEEYTIEGTLMVKPSSEWKVVRYKPGDPKADKDGYVYETVHDGKDTTPKEYLDENGNPVKASKTFIAESRNGYVDLEFKVDAAMMAGESIIAKEVLKYNDRIYSIHSDLEDRDEYHYFPDIRTTTRNTESKVVTDSGKEVIASENGSITDTIHYHNLIANRTYIVKGVLMDKATGEPMKDAKGNVITGTTTFKTKEVGEIKIDTTPDAVDYELADGTKLDMSSDHADYMCDGNVDVVFSGYDLTTLAGKVGVVFEEVYLVKDGKEVLVSEHKKIDDVDEFTYFVKIGTKATDKTTGIPVAPRNKTTIVKDEISFSNVIVGKTYEFTATFHVKDDKSGKYKDGDTLLGSDGKPVTAKVKYTPTTKEGTATVEIPLDTTVLESMQVVVFESMTNELGIEIAAHNDLEDEGQKVYIPGGKTKATDRDGKKTVKANTTVTVYDKLSYTNLKPGKEYSATGVLMLKETGEALTDANGNKVTNTVKFTPTEPDGTVTIPFEVNTSQLGGKTIVVFEDVYYEDVELFVEHNLNDEDQSLTVTPPTSPPKTGALIFFILLGLMIAGGAGMMIFKKKELKEVSDEE